jgi:hypothetical protein
MTFSPANLNESQMMEKGAKVIKTVLEKWGQLGLICARGSSLRGQVAEKNVKINFTNFRGVPWLTYEPN